MNGFIDKIEQKESEKFIKVLDEKYGKAIKTTGRFFGSFDAYKWELNDRIIRYCTVWDNEENKIKLVIHGRTLADSCRSLSHEIFHSKQQNEGRLTSNAGEDGDVFENEANSFSGKKMREFGRKYPEIYFTRYDKN